MSDLIRRDDAIEAIKNCSPPYVPIFTNDFYCAVKAVEGVPSAQPEGWMEQNKDRILKAGMEGREVEFRIGGRLFAIREKAQ